MRKLLKYSKKLVRRRRKAMDLDKRAMDIFRRTGYAFIATSSNGVSHLAVTSGLDFTGRGGIVVSEWFCPRTLENLEVNPWLSIVIWDPEEDKGVQIYGRKKDLKETEVLDGQPATMERNRHIPQVNSSLSIEVERVSEFVKGPHSDDRIRGK
ncbi:MAG: hypothetical protein GF409_04225 [Candidatus Omnitrophica bacterium]|nr:hypothetical protein [Candidatus Omnitrophota bacterium]